MTIASPTIFVARFGRRAFTLVELMISIALALVLMIGISQVFKYTSATAGATQAVSDGLKNARSAQSVFYRDLGNMVTVDAPAIIINSNQRFAFRGEDDAKADADGNTFSADFTAAGTESNLATYVYNSRSHRLDILSFFVRDLIKRATGGSVGSSGASPVISDLTSNEGWIWYGHLWQPDSTFAYDPSGATLPGGGNVSTNPFNFYATSWNVGRVAMVLKEKSNGAIPDPSVGAAELYVNALTPTAPVEWLTPLAYGSPANGAGGSVLQSSRLDLAATSISDYRNRLNNYINLAGNAGAWWQALMGSNANRFQTQPYFVKPLSPASYARQVPQFIPNCTQFIVEYAGDFISQDDNGNILGVGCYGYNDGTPGNPVTNVQNPAGTDGKIDFVWVGPVGNRTRQIRWYGMPRDVASPNGSLPDGAIAGYPTPVLNLVDVAPLRDVIKAYVEANYLTAGDKCVGASFEKTDYTTSPALPPLADYATEFTTASRSYTAAWGPDDILKPSLIRITMVIDDPAGRIAEGQSFEYVFKVQ